MRPLTAAARAGAAILVIGAVAATWSAVAPVRPFDFFGFFTIQANLIGAAVALVGAVRLLRSVPAGLPWTCARWAAATYLVVVGLVYWLVLAPLGAAGGVPVPWANLVLHGALPLLALVDWALAPDRVRVPGRLLPVVLAYPLVWTGVVLVRGATDGWVPYPFLSPTQGYPVVWAWVAAVAGAFAAVAALLRPMPRTRGR